MERARVGDLKIHLREETDGTGVLVVNAQAALFLDRVAVTYFRAFLDEWKSICGTGKDTGDPSTAASAAAPVVVRRVTKRFKVSPARANEDWQRLWGTVLSVASGGTCPFSDFEVKRIDPLSVELAAPYRCDLILTYRCQNDCGHCYAGGPHETAEMDTASWSSIIENLSDWGVPTLTFTGGEPLLRPDLDELVQTAETLGCVTGVITNGRLLTKDRASSLEAAGLDFAQVTLESSDEEVHDTMVGAPGAWAETVEGIRNGSERFYVTTNTTVTPHNKHTILDTIRFLNDLGVQKFGINALIRSGRGTHTGGLEPAELLKLLEEVVNLSSHLRFPFIWYTPSCYKELNPVNLGLGVKTCSAASTVLAVEPDGNVMPCQSYYRSLGNALRDDFKSIWKHPLAVALRARRTEGKAGHPDLPAMPAECYSCAELALCGGGCPLERRQE
ncbi:MAG: radical SAM protein [Bacillota bacterium]